MAFEANITHRMHSMRLSRLIPVLDGLIHYGNPFHIAYMRAFRKNGLMTISDRQTGVTLAANVKSYQMFGETWYNHDYDVPGCACAPMIPSSISEQIRDSFHAMQPRRVRESTLLNPLQKTAGGCVPILIGTDSRPA